MKQYKIADLTVNMDVSGRTLKQSEPFLISDEPAENCDIEISGLPMAVAKAIGTTVPVGADPDIVEHVISSQRFYKALVAFDGFMLHSSAVVCDGKAYLFSADKGVGKSTHTSFWLQQHEDAFILNDDKPAIRIVDDQIWVYGTPWNGKSKISVNKRVPLGGICFIYRNDHNVIKKMKTADVLNHFQKQTAHNRFKWETMNKLLSIWDRVLREITVYEMGCLPNPEAAELSFRTMRRG